MTTLPRKSLSDIRWPNWLVSEKFGAGMPCSDVPGSRLGFAAASFCCAAVLPAPDVPPCPLAPVAAPQPATAAAPTTATRPPIAARPGPHRLERPGPGPFRLDGK